MGNNIDYATVSGFGNEWSSFDQSVLDSGELQSIFSSYFEIFPWASLSEDSVGFDLGCGSGRWAKIVALRVRELHCIEPSSAIDVAKRNLANYNNCVFHLASVDSIPLDDGTMDFGYSLGVLHHVPDTQAALNSCVKKLKHGAPFLVYLYYSFDNRSLWYYLIWRLSDVGRYFISRLPYRLRYFVSQLIAFMVYLPLARTALLFEFLGFAVDSFPLSAYRNRSFYTMRTDSLDRFGTRLEQRFSRNEIKKMLEAAGLENISFSTKVPYWCAVGYRSLPSFENV